MRPAFVAPVTRSLFSEAASPVSRMSIPLTWAPVTRFRRSVTPVVAGSLKPLTEIAMLEPDSGADTLLPTIVALVPLKPAIPEPADARRACP